MTSRHLDTIVSLQHALVQLDDAQKRLAGVPDWMQELHEQHEARNTEIAALEQVIDQAASERRAAEAAIDDEQQKLKRYQQQINTVQNQREYGALLQEIDTAKRQIAALEEEGLDALERREQASEDLAAKREDFRDLDERYSTELAKWEAEKPTVSREIDGIEEQIRELKNELPRPFLALFERIYHHHGGNALAPIRSVARAGSGPSVWHCGVCNYRIRPQVVETVRNLGSLIQCEGCKRILFLEDQPPDEVQEVEA